MGSGIPSKLSDRVKWYLAHASVWRQKFAQVGLTQTQADAFDTATKAAQAAYDAAQAAREAAKNATLAQTAAVRIMNNLGGDAIRYINAFANSRDTAAARDAVYVAADLPLPTPAGTTPPPQVPQNFTADPNANGSVTLRWRATGNAGSVYIVQRKVGANGAWSQIGITGEKKFVDSTVPFGAPVVFYQARAQRGTQISAACEPYGVSFGSASQAA